MVIVSIPWWLWLIYAPLLLTFRILLWSAVLLTRLTLTGVRYARRRHEPLI